MFLAQSEYVMLSKRHAGIENTTIYIDSRPKQLPNSSSCGDDPETATHTIVPPETRKSSSHFCVLRLFLLVPFHAVIPIKYTINAYLVLRKRHTSYTFPNAFW